MKLQHPRRSSPYKTPENSVRDVLSGIRVANTHHVPATDTPDNSVVYPNAATKAEYDAGRRPEHTLYRKMEIKNKIIDSVEINWGALTSLTEDDDGQDNSKRAIATLIANNMSRFSEKNNQKGMLVLLAALSLLELSDGNDSLMAVAKRLVSYGLSGKSKR